MKIYVPPIKSQGIKTKLVPWINRLVSQSGIDLDNAAWVEPFFGTGVVGFNAPLNGRHIVGDTNPHIINFYKGIQSGEITEWNMRQYLQHESELLSNADDDGYAHYRLVRNRFNAEGSPFDFIFISRAGFNGMMRFNRKGEWNIPFCKKPERFSPAYITKICNQVANVSRIIKRCDWQFRKASFLETIKAATKNDIIYCDPPYFGRDVDYYNGWTEEDEERLFNALEQTPAKFILSTWHHNEFRENKMIRRFWSKYNVQTQRHFYHNGGSIENRHSMVEALVFNFDLQPAIEIAPEYAEQELFVFA